MPPPTISANHPRVVIGTRRAADIRVSTAATAFDLVALSHPLRLAHTTVHQFTVAKVRLRVADRSGRTASGIGVGVLSVPWAWPKSTWPWEARDQAMRALVVRLSDAAKLGEPSDALTLSDEVRSHARRSAEEVAAEFVSGEAMPALAVALAVGVVDNALHDAWSRAADKPALEMLTPADIREALHVDLERPRSHLPVQHVVGIGDPLTVAEATSGSRSLVEWLLTDQIKHLKIKVDGRVPRADAARVALVYQTAIGCGADVHSIALDPNEGYDSAAAALEMVEILRRDHADAFRRLRYIEQPIDRNMPPDPHALRALGASVPVVMDEALAGPEDIESLSDLGWSGLVIKASRGQSMAVRSYSKARAMGLFVTVQDLTAVDAALVHSARLASAMQLSAPAFEYNSRQFAPTANDRLAERQPRLVQVRGGAVRVSPPRPGIY